MALRAKFVVYSPDMKAWVAIWPELKTTELQAEVQEIKKEVKESISYHSNVNISVYRAVAESPKGQEMPGDFLVHHKAWLYIKTTGD
eukprot:5711772-Pyramimonas_sp.AAC.1